MSSPERHPDASEGPSQGAGPAIYPFYNIGPTDNGVFIIADLDSRSAALVDPTMQSHPLLDFIHRRGLKLEYIFNTHGHSDHIFNNAYFKENTGAKIMIHEGDLPLMERLTQSSLNYGIKATPSPEPDEYLEDGSTIMVGDVEVRVLHTPGHTPGSTCLYVDGGLFTGDTLFMSSIGRFQGPGGSGPALIHAVKHKVFSLPDDTVIYPGHGPPTTVGQERRYNPFFQPGSDRFLGFSV